MKFKILTKFYANQMQWITFHSWKFSSYNFLTQEHWKLIIFKFISTFLWPAVSKFYVLFRTWFYHKKFFLYFLKFFDNSCWKISYQVKVNNLCYLIYFNFFVVRKMYSNVLIVSIDKSTHFKPQTFSVIPFREPIPVVSHFSMLIFKP